MARKSAQQRRGSVNQKHANKPSPARNDKPQSSGDHRLSRADIDLLLNNTLYDEQHLNNWYQAFMKDCPSGNLEKRQLGDAYAQCFGPEKRDQFVSNAFRLFDPESKGVIDFKGFLIALSLASECLPEDKIKLAFAIYDHDRSGLVDKRTMTQIINTIYEMVEEGNRSGDRAPKNRANQIFKKAQKHQNRVRKDEFVKGCLEDEVVMEVSRKCVIKQE